MSDIADPARENVIKTFGTYDQYREGLTGRKKKKAEKHYSKLIANERKRLVKEKDKQFTKKDTGVVDVILQSYPGQSVIKKIKVLSGESILDPFTQEEEELYTGLTPHVLEMHSDIIPSWFARKFLPKKFRLRAHYRLWDQPFTRDLYTGGILAPEKKRKVLVERGFIDKEGYMLDVNGNRTTYEGCYIKVDVSDIDFIKSEFHALGESKAIEQAGAAMKKTGQTIEKWFFYLFALCIVGIVVVVFFMTGGLGGVT